LHTPASYFSTDPAASAQAALDAALRSLQSVLDEPLEDCLLRAPDGSPCVEIHTPHDLQVDLAMPGGNIFHGDLAWPWAETDSEVGAWGVETHLPLVFIGGSGARRGGAVSGIGGHNAAMAVQELLRNRR
jgi:phytoene dehydrogenase-like protein